MATRSLGQLTLDLIARVSGFTQGMDKAARSADTRSKEIDRSAKRIRNSIAGAFAAIGGGMLVRSIIQETAKAENQLAQLDAVLRSTGEAAGYSRDQLISMANDFAKVSVESSGSIIEAQTAMLSYSSIVGEQFPAAMQAAIDQSARLGISLRQSAEIIGRAIETPSRGVASLTRQGFAFTDQQRKMLKQLEESGRLAEAQTIVLDVLAESYGGAGKAARDTFGGALTAVQNSMKDLLAVRGGVPELTEEINKLADALSSDSIRDSADSLGGAFVKSLTAIGRTAMALLQPVAGFITLASDAGAYLDSKLLGRQLSESEFARIYGVRPRGAGPTTRGRAGRSSLGDADAIVDPTEEFLKIETSLKQQIALYGQTGEAAKIAYQIQSGELDKLSETEQQRVLQLAQQYDSLVSAATAAKELESAQAALARSYQSQVDNYERQIALTGEVSELQQLRWDIERGGLQGIDSLQTRYLEKLAMQVDLMNEVSEAIEAFAAQNATNLEESLSRQFEDLERQIEGTVDTMSTFAEQGARNMQDHFADFLFDPFDDGLKGMLKGFADTIRRMIAEAGSAKLFETLFGGGSSGSSGSNVLGSFLGGLFGGFKAEGGPLQQGKWYVAGERGPEPIWGGGPGAFAAGYQSDSQSIVYSPTYNIQSGVTRQELMPALEATRKQSVVDMTRLIRGGAFA